jgi:hypothetical protein
MGRSTGTETVDAKARMRPSPAAAMFIIDHYGIDAARERWFWLTSDAITKIASTGRQEAGTSVRRSTRRTTPEQEEAAIAEAIRLGSCYRAAVRLGLLQPQIASFFRERGLPIPKLTSAMKSEAARTRNRINRQLQGATS